MANPKSLLVGGGPRTNQNANQPNLRPHENQLNNAFPLRPEQVPAANPSLVHILPQIKNSYNVHTEN